MCVCMDTRSEVHVYAYIEVAYVYTEVASMCTYACIEVAHEERHCHQLRYMNI